MNEFIYTQEDSLYALSPCIHHKTIGLCSSHGFLGETFFGPIPRIEYVDSLGFFGQYWWTLDIKPPSEESGYNPKGQQVGKENGV